MSPEISPLDGRYRDRLGHLSALFSEQALVKARCRVEIHYMLALGETGLFAPLPPDTVQQALKLADSFSKGDFLEVKKIEAKTKHDVKACELYIRQTLPLPDPNIVHFGLTSEDVNNLAYGSILKEYRDRHQLPLVHKLMGTLARLALLWKDAPFPARTHGQLASPSTAGKELAVFLSRLDRETTRLEGIAFDGKLNGATGNYSAMVAAFPKFDWPAFSRTFVEASGLRFNPVTTQIEPHGSWCEYCDICRSINQVIGDLDVDMWLYISHGCFKLKTRPGEVGSSTMPHKVNPINFENSEGNLAISNSLLTTLSQRLSQSRMQRDLSDSTVQRNMGVALAHSHLAIAETVKGLDKSELDQEACLQQLQANPQLLAEPIQTVLRTHGVDDPYGMTRDLTRGRTLSPAQLSEFILQLPVSDRVKEQLNSLDVVAYTGLASRLCQETVECVVKRRGL